MMARKREIGMELLQRRNRGKGVEYWQQALNDVGSIALVVDGVFGPRTELATRAYQTARRLIVDGIVGLGTWAAMGRERFSTASALAVFNALRVARPRYPANLVADPSRSLAQASITSRRRLAAWLAQCAHESGRFAYLEELWGPTAQQRRYEPPSPVASMLGNTEQGDGYRFRGRGPIQCTGRRNYRLMGQRLRLPLEEQPELVAQPAIGLAVSAEFWAMHTLNDHADSGDFKRLTRKINGGLTGYPDRLALYNRARRILGLTLFGGAL